MQISFLFAMNESGQRLDQALAVRLPDYSRTQIQTWIQAGAVLLNGLPCQSKVRIKGNEAVFLTIPAKPQLTHQAEAIPLTVLYEDETLMVINKPVALVVHPGAGHRQHTLLNALLHHNPLLSQLPRAGIVHRLDKDTTGLMVVAKSALGLRELSRQLKERSILREYQAIVTGHFDSFHGIIDRPIARHPQQRQRMTVMKQGKVAITHYTVLEKYRCHSLLSIILKTGRTHQIRVHMAHIHHSVLGDPVYGKSSVVSRKTSLPLLTLLRSCSYQALCSYRLGLIHPLHQGWMQWKIDLPDSMQALIVALRQDKQLLSQE